MVYISQIVKKWRDNVAEETSAIVAEGEESVKNFQEQARALLKKISRQHNQEREASREKFSEILSQLSKATSHEEEIEDEPVEVEVEVEVEVDDEQLDVMEVEVPSEYDDDDDEEEEEEEIETNSETEVDWGDETDGFTEGLYEENPILPQAPEVKIKEPKKKKEERVPHKREPKVEKPKEDDWNIADGWNIESVLKSMKSNGESGAKNQQERLGKKRRDNPRRKTDRDKKNNRHKWV